MDGVMQSKTRHWMILQLCGLDHASAKFLQSVSCQRFMSGE
jgi:hypothetical protein